MGMKVRKINCKDCGVNVTLHENNRTGECNWVPEPPWRLTGSNESGEGVKMRSSRPKSDHVMEIIWRAERLAEDVEKLSKPDEALEVRVVSQNLQAYAVHLAQREAAERVLSLTKGVAQMDLFPDPELLDP